MLILASASPRRAELLRSAGFAFEVVPAGVDETPRHAEEPRDYALRIALEKARASLATRPGSALPLLAADTVVVAGGQILGKPADTADARRMLRLLSGSVHEVHTGVVLLLRRGQVLYSNILSPGQFPAQNVGIQDLTPRSEVVTTRVRFVPMTNEEIDWYVASGEPEGKAGAYAIQGRAARFIDWIEGSWSNVVGLPIAAVYRLLGEAGETRA